MRRGRQLLLVSVALGAGLALALVAAYAKRATCLIGLPDVGDPFDVAAFESGRVPDGRNAFAFYRRAMEGRGPRPQLPRPALDAIPTLRWAEVDPALRAWAESNREAIALFLEGSRRTESWARQAEDESTFHYDRFYMEPLVQLAMLDAARLEDAGDSGGAWERYRAILAMLAHLMQGGTAIERGVANQDSRMIPARIATWASDRMTTAELIRRAIEETIALEPRPEWEASSLKVEYLLAMRELDRPDGVLGQGDDRDFNDRILGEPSPPGLIQWAHSVRRFLIREPERTRRILRLAFANWLDHVESPDRRGAKPVVRVRLENEGRDSGLFLYAVEPSSEQPLAPKALAEWMLSAPDLRRLEDRWHWGALRHAERRRHREILIALAGELYRREKGRPHADEEELVGAYLDRLPDDSSELDDLAETIEEVSRVALPAP
ncbi:hypothetical protein [Paludisphaera soli]|uniref:hypothetical protein n=1 Tax=Paludisphaera soli TaxID=2712865 RepID=UPI0013EA5544|nr:hypothetical protein [Paludisphaera soli]